MNSSGNMPTFSLHQSIKIVRPGARTAAALDSLAVEIDGISKATASARIVNETLIAAALQVARAKLGFSVGRDLSRAARVRKDVFAPLSFEDLLARGYVRKLQLTNAEVERAFAGSEAAGLDAEALQSRSATFTEVYQTQIDVPIIGRNLLGEANWRKLVRLLDGGSAMFVASTGRWTFMPENFTLGGTPDYVALLQAGAPVIWRDFVWSETRDPPTPELERANADVAILHIPPEAAYDTASPSEISVRVIRQKGLVYPENFTVDFKLDYSLPKDLFEVPPEDNGLGLASIWTSRSRDISILCGVLAVLAVALSRQKSLVHSPRRLKTFRLAFLAFNLIFIGWIAQAQMSIVWLVGLAKAIKGEGGFQFLLWDPPTLIVAIFGLGGLFIWGRGTFCGWLCPFGSLQEFVGENRGNRAVQDRDHLDLHPLGALRALYGCVAAVRAVPLQIFCRYLCPLGAALSALSFVRRSNWIARHKECETPCQLCRVKCRYGAITGGGSMIYSECFQCLDCVAIHDDPKRCAPLMLKTKTSRRASAK
ncbi:Regulator of nitric oxide reductase transcription [Rhodoblastus acidophilus]|uniref:Regulator of nitric oxide reductase transcription n=1 Tax=Rhodoblastus acidophilus TaxID=1074 RepID=A0A212SGR3_RHOAC|nr:4Fe-4S binding protein [Rhodoblastus acidophilus]SNB84796.1 Regulator of nitric oxide reductase transcription [Rhodoblastus acidophilus]